MTRWRRRRARWRGPTARWRRVPALSYVQRPLRGQKISGVLAK